MSDTTGPFFLEIVNLSTRQRGISNLRCQCVNTEAVRLHRARLSGVQHSVLDLPNTGPGDFPGGEIRGQLD